MSSFNLQRLVSKNCCLSAETQVLYIFHSPLPGAVHSSLERGGLFNAFDEAIVFISVYDAFAYALEAAAADAVNKKDAFLDGDGALKSKEGNVIVEG